jgi:two-component sensor histidine kinase
LINEKEFDIVAIIASRKTEFYLKATKRLLSLLLAHAPLVNKNQADLRLRQIISQLDDLLFISDEEKASKTIDPTSSISRLKLNDREIIDRIVRSMTTVE